MSNNFVTEDFLTKNNKEPRKVQNKSSVGLKLLTIKKMSYISNNQNYFLPPLRVCGVEVTSSYTRVGSPALLLTSSISQAAIWGGTLLQFSQQNGKQTSCCGCWHWHRVCMPLFLSSLWFGFFQLGWLTRRGVFRWVQHRSGHQSQSVCSSLCQYAYFFDCC